MAIVKVRQLDRLFFETSDVPGARCIDAANVKRIIHRFQLEGCHRLDPATWISSELPRSDLHEVYKRFLVLVCHFRESSQFD